MFVREKKRKREGERGAKGGGGNPAADVAHWPMVLCDSQMPPDRRMSLT